MSSYYLPKEIKSNPIKCAKIKKLVESGQTPVIKILKYFETKAEATAHEISLIADIGTIAVVLGVDKRGPLSNLHVGGQGGYIPRSQETLNAMSTKLKGRIISPEWRAKISATKTGNTHHSEETRKLISERTSEALMSNLEARQKISNTHLGKPKSEDHRKKLAKHLRVLNKNPEINARKLQSKIDNGTLSPSQETKDKISKTALVSMNDPKVTKKLKRASKKRWENPEERLKIADKNSKTFQLTHKETGETFVIKNLAQYCRENSTHHRKVHLEFIVEQFQQ